MHVVIVTKSTLDKEAKISVDDFGALTWDDTQTVINPWDEYSVTEAILLKEAYSVKVTALSVGTELDNVALKLALAIGADEAVRLWDDSMQGQDSLGYATAVAAAIVKIGDVDLVIFGKEFMDLGTNAHIFQTARKLGWPALGSYLKIASVDFNARTITLDKLLDEGIQTLTSVLPAVISLAQDINEPKYPSFIGIRKAAKAVILVWSSADLGIGEAASGSAAKVVTVGFTNLPAWEGSVEIIDGSSDAEKAEKLAARLFEDNVL